MTTVEVVGVSWGAGSPKAQREQSDAGGTYDGRIPNAERRRRIASV